MVERTNDSPSGPRIAMGLVLLAAALVVAWLILRPRAPGEGDLPRTAVTGQAADPGAARAPAVAGSGPIEAYLSGCGSGRSGATEGWTPEEYELQCLMHLGEALGAVVLADTLGASALDPHYREFRRTIRDVESIGSSRPGERAEALRAAGEAAVGLMDEIRASRFPTAPHLERSIEEVRTATSALQPGIPLLEQRSATAQFFRRSGDAVQALAEANAAARARTVR